MDGSEKKAAGTGRGCFIFIGAAVAAVVLAAAVFLWRAGGWDGFQRQYLYAGSLNKVQQTALDLRPDGVSASEIDSAFDAAREAVMQDRIDLDALADALKSFIEKHKEVRSAPSNAEMTAFLESLRAAIDPSNE